MCAGGSVACRYVETNWNLPLWEQINLARQNIYDGTWSKIPSQGWMFVPLVQCKAPAQTPLSAVCHDAYPRDTYRKGDRRAINVGFAQGVYPLMGVLLKLCWCRSVRRRATPRTTDSVLTRLGLALLRWFLTDHGGWPECCIEPVGFLAGQWEYYLAM